MADVNSALLQTFPTDTRYSEPDILGSRAYNTPFGLNPTSVVSTKLLDFKTQEDTFSVNDLLTIGDPNSPQVETAWPVVKAYTPYSSSKTAQVLYENLAIQKIQKWAPGVYTQGQVFRNPEVENSLLVVLRNFSFSDISLSPEQFILDGTVSAPKDFVSWSVGSEYYVNNINTGFYDPDIIVMDQELNPDPAGRCQKRFFEPAGVDNLYYRVGWYCFVATSDFFLQASTDTTPGAQVAGNTSNVQTTVKILKSGGTYTQGSWVKTPSLGGGPDEEVDPYYFYVDLNAGVITKYAYVRKTFTFLPSAGRALSESFDDLVKTGTLEIVNAVNGLLPQPLFQYSPRFAPQTLISYRASAQSENEYYFSLTGFTPTSGNASELVEQGVISRIDTSPSIRAELERQITPNSSNSVAQLCPPTPMFVFSPGDTTLFRQQSTIISYMATKHFSPVFTPAIYISAGILVPTEVLNKTTIPFFASTGLRKFEEILLSEDGKNMYRVTRYFTAKSPAYNWDGQEVVDTVRIEELSGNLLRVVTRYVCEEQIKSPNGPDTSGIKLGITQLSLRAKNAIGAQNIFVWENTNFASEVPALSYATGGKEAFNPVSYGDGTLAL